MSSLLSIGGQGDGQGHRGLLGSVSALQRVVVGNDHLGGPWWAVRRAQMRFGWLGQPCERGMRMQNEEYNTNFFRVFLAGKGGGHWGSSFEIGGSAVVRTTMLG